jgi:hypothetical protein
MATFRDVLTYDPGGRYSMLNQQTGPWGPEIANLILALVSSRI